MSADSAMPQPSAEDQARIKAGIAFAVEALGRLPDEPEREFCINAVLNLFWAALWGSYGTEYARGYIQAQLAGMEGEAEMFTKRWPS